MATYTPLQLLPLPPNRSGAKPIPTCLSVDPFSDILWVGTSSGLVSAYCNPLELAPNVRFPAHGAASSVVGYSDGWNATLQERKLLPGQNAAVKEIRVTDREVWTLAEGGVGGRKKGGAPRWSVSDPLRSLRSMSPNPVNSHEVLVGGVGQMMLINTSRGEVVRKLDSAPIVHLAPLPRTVMAASATGSISLLDPRSGFRPTQTVQTHTGGLSGADANGHLLCTWGWTHMQGRPLPDPLIRLFDIRTLRPMAPVTFPPGPAFCLLHPTDSSAMVVCSQSGALQSVDLSHASAGSFQQLSLNSYVTAATLSPLGDYLALGDADGQVHLLTTHDTSGYSVPPFNGYEGNKPEWPDAAEPPASIVFDETTPLNLIGMPHYTEPLLSNFPTSDYAPVTSPFFNPPEIISSSVLNTMKTVDFVGYASLPKELRGKRYVRTARPGAGKRATGKAWTQIRRDSGPKFRSEKERKRQVSVGEVEEETPPGEIPKYYRKVEIKYSKFGIEDFDFGYYNRTDYSGLETDILNSYTNALLQVLHYSQPIRAVAKAHICIDCKKEHCLLCEAGFLFRMLEDARGTNCQASNFSRAFSATPQATALGLMDNDEKSTAPYGSLIQSFNRWLLSTFSAEANVPGQTLSVRQLSFSGLQLKGETAIDQVVGIKTRTSNKCSACGYETSRDGVLHVIDLQYLRKPLRTTFPELLRTSLLRESSTKANCLDCKQFVPLESHRTIEGDLHTSLPAVLSVNAMVATPEVFEVWRDRPKGDQVIQFLPRRIAFSRTAEGIVVNDGDSGVVYNLTSIVLQIQETPESPAHLLSFVKTGNGEEGEDSWTLFNDFLVRHVKEEEVFSFTSQWKVPAVLMFERRDAADVLDLARLPSQIDPSVLSEDVSLAWNRRPNMIKHELLSPAELPTPGTLIAIDSEFVALQQEEMEFRSDGTKKVLRPSHMSLARVSVIRGEGEMEGRPFIDDYILTKEVVVDFLTEFSGIKHGDLDANNSHHTLVPLKVAYKKLRLLVDLGCVFIGHGLAKDFRTINIFVPPDQILDTVHLYTAPSRQRKLSLRFLAWFLLKKDIQTASHDSIEDAKYALLLYKAYVKYEEEGRFEDLMEEIFEEGQKLGFKPPHERANSPGNLPLLPPLPLPTPPQAPAGRSQRHLQPPAQHWQAPTQAQAQQHSHQSHHRQPPPTAPPTQGQQPIAPRSQRHPHSRGSTNGSSEQEQQSDRSSGSKRHNHRRRH